MGVLLLTEEDVRHLLTMEMCLEAVEEVLRKHALDEAVNIPRSPLDVPDAFAKGTDEAATRARVVLEVLEPGRPDWDAAAERSARASTSLSPMGEAVTIDLLRHGYVLAMVNLHVILGYPWLDVPTRESFEAMVR